MTAPILSTLVLSFCSSGQYAMLGFQIEGDGDFTEALKSGNRVTLGGCWECGSPARRADSRLRIRSFPPKLPVKPEDPRFRNVDPIGRVGGAVAKKKRILTDRQPRVSIAKNAGV
jgi:hypothetical protein